MKFKSLPIAAIFGCYVFGFGSAAIAQQVCPVGGGACVTRPGPAPASSYSNARAVDIMIRQPVPVIPTAQSLLPEILPLLPTAGGTVTTGILSGVLVGNVAGLQSGTMTTYFCVAGQGVNLGDVLFYSGLGHPSQGPACPTGSGAFVLGGTQITNG